jgi:hypothetical protein
VIRLSVIDPVRILAQFDMYELRYLKVGDFVLGETIGTGYVVENVDDSGKATLMLTSGRRKTAGKRL